MFTVKADSVIEFKLTKWTISQSARLPTLYIVVLTSPTYPQ